MASYYDKFKKLMSEDNTGLNYPIKRFNDVIPGIQKGRIYLIGAASGVSKSKLTMEFYVFNPFHEWYYGDRKENINIHVFSLEMPEEELIANLSARWLYKQHDILVDSSYILGHIKDKQPDDFIKKLLESDEFIEYMTEFEKMVKILDFTINSVSLSKYIENVASEQGEILKETIVTKDNTSINVFKEYIPNNKLTYNIFVIDHIGLVKTISGQTQKTMIDDVANILIKARNRYKFTFCAVQQLNRGSNSVERHKLEDLIIKDSDYAGGSGLFNAANIVIGLMSPTRENQTNFLGYQIANNSERKGMGSRMIVLNIVKNRSGPAFLILPLLFLGEIGLYSALPKASVEFDYSILTRIKKYYE